MTAQSPLFPEPHWSDRWQVGDRVSSTATGNTGKVVAVVSGRHLLVEWSPMGGRDGYVVRHSSELHLKQVDA